VTALLALVGIVVALLVGLALVELALLVGAHLP